MLLEYAEKEGPDVNMHILLLEHTKFKLRICVLMRYQGRLHNYSYGKQHTTWELASNQGAEQRRRNSGESNKIIPSKI